MSTYPSPVTYVRSWALGVACSVLALLGAGCASSVSVQDSEPVHVSSTISLSSTASAVTSTLTSLSEAAYLERVLATTSTWVLQRNERAGVQFEYPEGLFVETVRDGERSSGLAYSVETFPTEVDDGVCDGLGDPDCEKEKWPKRLTNFQEALRGKEYQYIAFQMFPILQDVRVINGRPFVRSVAQGVNGACSLVYSHPSAKANLTFFVNVCDDPGVHAADWQGNTVDDAKRTFAANVLAGEKLSDSTNIKIQAIERVLQTLMLGE